MRILMIEFLSKRYGEGRLEVTEMSLCQRYKTARKTGGRRCANEILLWCFMDKYEQHHKRRLRD
jgi:hypothetical protein